MKALGRASIKRESGFTIVEVLIVLAIAALIMLIVFLAVPALQRNWRNSARKRDASMMYAAINECLSANLYNWSLCNEVDELPIDVSKFSIYTGLHFGAACTNWTTAGCDQRPPTVDEPNWLNHLVCRNGDSLLETIDNKKYLVGYFIETPGSPGIPPHLPPGWSGRCIPDDTP